MDIPIIQHSTTIAIRSFNVICIFTLLILLRRQETEQQQEQSEQNQAAVEDVNNFFEFEERDLMDQHEVQLASLAQHNALENKQVAEESWEDDHPEK